MVFSFHKLVRYLCVIISGVLISLSIVFSVAANQYQIERLNISDGLPSTLVTMIYQQKNGFLWFATDSGVSRYDGQAFIHFQFSPGSKRHISNNFVTDIIEDSQGNIWFATEDGLNQLNLDDQLSIYPLNLEPFAQNTNWITKLYQDPSNNLWVGTGSGLQFKSASSAQFISIPLYLNQQKTAVETSIYSIVADQQQRLWVGTDFGLAVLEPNTQALHLFEPNMADNNSNKVSTPITAKTLFNDYILSSEVAENGLIWFGTQNYGLIRFNPNNKSYQHYYAQAHPQQGDIISNYVTSIAIENPQTIWVSTNKGVGVLSIASGQFDWITSQAFNEHSLPSDFIDDVFIDSSGLVWFASTQGVGYYSPLKQASRMYKPLANDSELSGENVFALSVNKQHHVWVASNNGLDTIDLEKKTATLSPLTNESDNTLISSIWNVQVDAANNVWASHDKGLSYFDAKSQHVTHYSNAPGNPYGFPQTDFYTVTPDNKGNVWITGYLNAGVMLFSPSEGILKHYFNDNENLYTSGGNFTFDAIIIDTGELWLATTNGIFIIDSNSDKTTHLSLGNDRENIRTSGIYQDEQGVIWATTQGLGLAKITPTTKDETPYNIEYITRKDGLTDNRLKAVTGDEQGNLWITSRQMLTQYASRTGTITHYPSAINHSNLIFNEAAIDLIGNQLVIGSNKGVIQIDITAISQNHFIPPVHITAANTANKSYVNINNNVDAVTVDYDNNMIQFSFASLDFTAPERNKYRFMLEGFDDDWITTQQHNAMYTNLPAGDYTFKVQSTNSDGIWSPQQAEFAFSINQAWWFYALIALAITICLMSMLFALSRFKQIKELSNRANYDSLTGLANRFYFNQQLSRLINTPTQTAAVVFIDLDHFKEVNDSMGHDIGDELIIQVAKRLQHCLKHQDVLARLGGDEFALIIQYEPDENRLNQDLVNIIERFRSSLNAGYQINEFWLNSSASIGVACYPNDGKDAKTLLKHADTAMYAAKQNGRNGSYFFNEKLSAALLERLLIKNQLNNALPENQLVVYYQPKCCAHTQSILGLEALIRWQHPTDGLISPTRFIDQAEDSGLIIDIGLWVLAQACHQGYQWQQQGILQGNISVNISPLQLSQPTIVEDIALILQQSQFPAHMLELEITESLLITDIKAAKAVLFQLKQLKVRIALDDFGKGYSSLNYLTQFPIDTLKIDKAFIHSMLPVETSNIVLKNIIKLGNELQLDVIAEGVETHAQLVKLRHYQCKIVQGFLFGPALNALATQSLLKQSYIMNDKLELANPTG
ncbi:EAL domain-containing protein [Shewanella algicola]|uniref:EAL domain-containing protein n=1 Tax=Shewanella algicola TaxID=640633 RepID=UPI0024942699|nr:EAL domain-containing protein [Shewanella algicola]